MRIIITGATAGIGLGCVRAFCGEGNQVIGIARRAKNLSNLEKEHSCFTGISCDIADEACLEELSARIAEAADDGPVDVLINNAGYGAAGPVETVPLSEWKAQYATNVFGTIGVTQAALPLLRKSRRGRIINVSSVAGSVHAPFFAPYYSSKHALECISKALRMELRDHGIEVTVIAPGAVDTGFANHEDAMLERSASESNLSWCAVGSNPKRWLRRSDRPCTPMPRGLVTRSPSSLPLCSSR
jgi:NAD(P)-dependent dehydrogenase (short-subunit alcohol dehydrogenase family)